MDDATIRQAILEALETDERLSSLPIEVRVEGGRVTLSGRVQSFRRKLAASQVAAAVSPSLSIDNQLEVKVPDSRTDDEIAEDVRAVLEAQEGLAQRAVVVDVRVGRVTLSGSVNDESERQLAEDVALQAHGAREVTNQLVIAPQALDEATVVSAELESTLSAMAELDGCDLRIELSGDVAVLSGVVRSRAQVEVAVRRVRERWLGELRDDVTVAD